MILDIIRWKNDTSTVNIWFELQLFPFMNVCGYPKLTKYSVDQCSHHPNENVVLLMLTLVLSSHSFHVRIAFGIRLCLLFVTIFAFMICTTFSWIYECKSFLFDSLSLSLGLPANWFFYSWDQNEMTGFLCTIYFMVGIGRFGRVKWRD